MRKESTKQKQAEGKVYRSGSADHLDPLAPLRRPYQTTLEAVICQKIPTDSLHHPAVAFVSDQGDPQPSHLHYANYDQNSCWKAGLSRSQMED